MAKQKKNKYQEYEDAYDEYEAIYGDDYDGYSDDDPVSSEQADFRDDDDVRLSLFDPLKKRPFLYPEDLVMQV